MIYCGLLQQSELSAATLSVNNSFPFSDWKKETRKIGSSLHHCIASIRPRHSLHLIRFMTLLFAHWKIHLYTTILNNIHEGIQIRKIIYIIVSIWWAICWPLTFFLGPLERPPGWEPPVSTIKCLKIVSQSRRWRFQMSLSVRPTVQNTNIRLSM